LPVVPVHQRCGFLEFALELEVFSEIANHVDLLLDIGEVLLFLQETAVVARDIDVQPEAMVIAIHTRVEVLA
jgi:hypothetical protein